MSTHSEPNEERAYVRALGRLMEHVGKCPDCAELVRAHACAGCGGQVASFASMSNDGGFCEPCTDAYLKSITTIRMPGEPTPPRPTAPRDVLDLSDPATALCPRGRDLRAAADLARAETPAERLIAFYALEGLDVAVADSHDARRGAEWLRGDPGRARVIMEQLVERAGPLEERDAPQEDLRAAFLIGFRKVSPSRGAAPTEAERAKKAAAADRLCALVFDRYERRHGAPPPAEAAAEFRRGHDLWLMESGDLARMADDVERFRGEHPKHWAGRALLKPKDPLRELQKIAASLAERLIQDESQKG